LELESRLEIPADSSFLDTLPRDMPSKNSIKNNPVSKKPTPKKNARGKKPTKKRGSNSSDEDANDKNTGHLKKED
jgi:hypothetical protein